MNKFDWNVFADTYLDFNVWIVVSVGLLLFALYMIYIKFKRQSIHLSQIIFGVFWSIYVLVVITSTILNRQIGEETHLYLTPFWSYKEAMEEGSESIIWQILYNIVMFIPWGIFLANMWENMKKPHWNILSALLASVMIELIQLTFKCGTVELDDVFHNVLGAITGYGIWRAYYELNLIGRIFKNRF